MGTAGNSEAIAYSLINWALGLGGEAGEFEDHIKKAVFHGHNRLAHPLGPHDFNTPVALLLSEGDRHDLVAELGDMLWYLTLAAHALGATLEEVAEINNDKLRARYGEKFSAERSINRKEYASG